MKAGRSEMRQIGWFCSYVPEEIILAAGLDPIRLPGRAERIKAADAVIFANACPFVKNILESGLGDRMDDVDGIVFTNSCDCMRRLYDLWQKHRPTPFTYMLEIPRNRSEAGVRYLASQFSDLKKELEGYTGRVISGEDLSKAIDTLNDRRRVMTDIFEAQKADPAPLSGSALLTLFREETGGSKTENGEGLKNLAAQLGSNDKAEEKRPRILILGNTIDNPALPDMIEAAGASTVIFDSCNGLKHYALPVEKEGDPIESLARRYLFKPHCARMPDIDSRLIRLGQLIDEYSIDGVIYSSLKYCDYSLFETPPMEALLKEKNTPFLILENDYLWGDVERLRIRVEAFLEVIQDDLD